MTNVESRNTQMNKNIVYSNIPLGNRLVEHNQSLTVTMPYQNIEEIFIDYHSD